MNEKDSPIFVGLEILGRGRVYKFIGVVECTSSCRRRLRHLRSNGWARTAGHCFLMEELPNSLGLSGQQVYDGNLLPDSREM